MHILRNTLSSFGTWRQRNDNAYVREPESRIGPHALYERTRYPFYPLHRNSIKLRTDALVGKLNFLQFLEDFNLQRTIEEINEDLLRTTAVALVHAAKGIDVENQPINLNGVQWMYCSHGMPYILKSQAGLLGFTFNIYPLPIEAEDSIEKVNQEKLSHLIGASNPRLDIFMRDVIADPSVGLISVEMLRSNLPIYEDIAR
jgi:hypothetical protein